MAIFNSYINLPEDNGSGGRCDPLSFVFSPLLRGGVWGFGPPAMDRERLRWAQIVWKCHLIFSGNAAEEHIFSSTANWFVWKYLCVSFRKNCFADIEFCSTNVQLWRSWWVTILQPKDRWLTDDFPIAGPGVLNQMMGVHSCQSKPSGMEAINNWDTCALNLPIYACWYFTLISVAFLYNLHWWIEVKVYWMFAAVLPFGSPYCRTYYRIICSTQQVSTTSTADMATLSIDSQRFHVDRRF